MFQFFPRVDYDAAPLVRHIIDVTIPNKPVANDKRGERRFNRTLPAVMAPIRLGKPDLKRCFMGLSQDFSDHSLAIVTTNPLKIERCFASLWPSSSDFPTPIHLRCRVASCRSLALGFWTAGLVIEDVMNIKHPGLVARLDKVARRALDGAANDEALHPHPVIEDEEELEQPQPMQVASLNER